MKNKVCLIIDSSEAFLRTKTQEIYESWGFKREHIREITQWTMPAQGQSLFGSIDMTVLNLTNKNDLKQFVALFSDKNTKKLFDTPAWIGYGLIITSSTAVGTKKIENLIKKYSGVVIKKEKSQARKNELLNSLSVSTSVKNAVNQYVGEDYDLMLSFVNSVSKLPVKEQKGITLEQAFGYFPPTPGSVPPWDFITPLLAGDTVKTVKLFKRTVKNTHVLVCMTFLRRNIELAYKLCLARLDGYSNDSQIATAIDEKNGPAVWNASKLARKLNPNKANKILMIMNETDNALKGGSSINPNSVFEFSLLRICSIINS